MSTQTPGILRETKSRQALFAAAEGHGLGSWCAFQVCVLLFPTESFLISSWSLGHLVILPSGSEPQSPQRVLDTL